MPSAVSHQVPPRRQPKLSFVGVALLKVHALAWIVHIKMLLEVSIDVLATLRLHTTARAKKLVAYLSFLVAFTLTKTWKLLSAMQQLIPGMNQPCQNLLGHLVTWTCMEASRLLC